MVVVKKSTESGGVESLDILAARLRIVETELTLEEREVTLEKGGSFMAEPNLNCRILVVKNLIEPGAFEGQTFFDRFKLKRGADGDWVFARYCKLGALTVVRYGAEWFEDPSAEFEEEDFLGFEFIGTVRPKTDHNGRPLKGSIVDWKSIRPATAEMSVVKQAREAIEVTEDDFEDIDF
jgi:hypothetical protein